MATISQKRLFGWDQIEALGDLKRLRLVLESMPDEALMKKLEQERGRSRDDYPIRAMWNALVAGVVFQHPTVEALLRELKRNAQLRQVCGFELAQGLPDYGLTLALDGKALPSWARGKREEATAKQDPGGRGDSDGEWGIHEHRGAVESDKAWSKVKKWFGYSIHLLVDSRYELPVSFSVTRANASEVVEAHQLLDKPEEQHPAVVERCQELAADRGYDDGKLIRKLWDEWQVLPIIDIRNCWQDGDKTKVVSGFENVVYDYRGTVSCVCLKSGTQRQMAYGGFERDRMTLKYRCPAQHYGYRCEGQDGCAFGKAVRTPLAEERRVFTPLPRSSQKWERSYDKRTAVERLNSRLDVSFGFERHTIRGLTKMYTRCCLALVVMLAMAAGRIKEQQERMRSLVKPAA